MIDIDGLTGNYAGEVEAWCDAAKKFIVDSP
jgi:hypothetical protein